METVCGFIESKGYGIYLRSDDLTPETLEKAVIRAESMKVPEIDPGAERAAAIIREVAR
jgi:UDP-N-acetylglucosamine:LPS N-acetylglucosamine transferase